MHGNNETPAAAEAGRDADQNRVEPTGQKSLDPLLQKIKQKHGDSLLAILVYGSWLRGKRDTMLDFYVLVENYHTLDSAWQGWMCRLLPPNVYQIHGRRTAWVEGEVCRVDSEPIPSCNET
jgi:hypothetical protein